MAKVHPRVPGYLGRALSLELTAVQQYITHASLLELWGDQDSADRFRQETVEELRHVESIVKRMLALGVAPSSSQLQPVTHASDLVGLLRLNQQLEGTLIQHYAEAIRFCVLIGDGENEGFFRTLWSDEEHHGEELATWLRSLDGYGRFSEERATF
jgi:bacterioferritin